MESCRKDLMKSIELELVELLKSHQSEILNEWFETLMAEGWIETQQEEVDRSILTEEMSRFWEAMIGHITHPSSSGLQHCVSHAIDKWLFSLPLSLLMKGYFLLKQCMTNRILNAIKPGEQKIDLLIRLVNETDEHVLVISELYHQISKQRLAKVQGKLAERNKKLTQISQRLWKTNRQLKDATMVDEPTGLLNVNAFAEAVRREIVRCERYKYSTVIVIFKVSNFELIRGKYEKKVFDSLFKEVGHLLQFRLRLSDVLARYSDDSFILMLPQTNLDGSLHVVEKLKNSIERYAFGGKHNIFLKISYTYSVCPKDGNSARALMMKANPVIRTRRS